MNEYEKQAQAFLEKTKTTLRTWLLGTYKYFPDDKLPRDVYEITLTREGKKPYTFTFGQSLVFPGARIGVAGLSGDKNTRKNKRIHMINDCRQCGKHRSFTEDSYRNLFYALGFCSNKCDLDYHKARGLKWAIAASSAPKNDDRCSSIILEALDVARDLAHQNKLEALIRHAPDGMTVTFTVNLKKGNS